MKDGACHPNIWARTALTRQGREASHEEGKGGNPLPLLSPYPLPSPLPLHHAGGEAASWAACARGLWAASGRRGRGGREAGGGGGTDVGDERQDVEGGGGERGDEKQGVGKAGGGGGGGAESQEAEGTGDGGGSGAGRRGAVEGGDGSSGGDIADVLGSSEHLRGRGAAGPGLLVALQIRRGLPLLLAEPPESSPAERGE